MNDGYWDYCDADRHSNGACDGDKYDVVDDDDDVDDTDDDNDDDNDDDDDNDYDDTDDYVGDALSNHHYDMILFVSSLCCR